jgi:hypothetical protein
VARESADRLMSEEVSRLNAVFRFGVIAQDAARGAIEHAVVSSHDLLESIQVTHRDPSGEREVVFIVSRGCSFRQYRHSVLPVFLLLTY